MNIRRISLVFTFCVGCSGTYPATRTPATSAATPTVGQAAEIATAEAVKPGAVMIDIKSAAEIYGAVGKTVRVVGFPVNSKASPQLNLEGKGMVNCDLGATHWPDEFKGKKIVVTGKVILLAGPIYPVATQDENGAWSQGVGSSEMVLAPSPDGITTTKAKPAKPTKPAKVHRDVVIQVISQALAE